MSFDTLGLSASLLDAVRQKGYTQPSPIQAKAIPAVLQGRDVMAAAQTGTGKTAGFTLPVLQLLSAGQRAKPGAVRALVLTPTRELAAQVEDNIQAYGRHLPLRSAVVFGGVGIHPQIAALKKGVDILVATPGRLLDLFQQKALHFRDLEILILDEADRMLDMGFIHDIRRIIKVLPTQRQNLMFSATFSDDIRKLARTIVNDPVEVDVSPRNSTAELVVQTIFPVDKKRKPALLSHLIKARKWHQVLVFSRTKHGANKLVKLLEADGIPAAAIHGNKSQTARTKALADFKAGKVTTLVATDIAARGIDIQQLPQVVNFDLPNVSEDYVHRIGRTGRAGADGQAFSLVCADEFDDLKGIERLIKRTLERVEIEGFEPLNNLPASPDPTQPRRGSPPRRSGPGNGNNNGGRNNSGRAQQRRGGGGDSNGGSRSGNRRRQVA
ncbi:DEAD/DEAH box helicase [Natronospirillum operosum]|uniref:ATP-dependent RNA helicase RhlE n=1 Tax=Natronospirillum operosum TaxID=2759953 RepID=A0A4Z0W8B4_9GAMM|nr:DEAD/DEAH box helicase [Natronospirillum operosum]TGG91288.1 DEAD/DEAH box helicase [Natronospirillum operosum]